MKQKKTVKIDRKPKGAGEEGGGKFIVAIYVCNGYIFITTYTL